MLLIREITLGDAEAVAKLSGELGYPASAAEMELRINALREASNHAVFVACASDSVVGWIDVSLTYHLQAEPKCEIGGLVVGEGCRNGGTGRELLARAEEWGRSRGVREMLVRSRVTREAAHRFYRREGYRQTKVSAVFSKSLG